MHSSCTQSAESEATVASITTEAPKTPTKLNEATEAAPPQEPEAHDVPYFRRMVKQESTLLDELCDKWSKVLEDLTDVSEEGNSSGWYIQNILPSVYCSCL